MFPLASALRAATAVALLGGSALAGAAAATADPDTGSSTDIDTLTTTLSKGYSLDNCQPAPLSGPVLAELDCGQSPDPNGPAAGVYQLFGNGTDLAAAFTSGIHGVSLSPCGDNGESPGTWRQGSYGQNAGQVACGTYKNAAVITWTTDAKNVLSHVRASNTDVNALYQWWRTNG
ncbi:serine/threonine protein kinase [Mycobacterium alsense]|uniref:Serine/threonine protein kinase n=1 Tax=Mycobacterium alsense TaxID=324058 RepID=A0ABD6P1X5_9MYCO|nr:serine/threonine protein kinase [Mycobacterium alsense]OBG39769.1 serine/threonine protein kinase [Mycobacterium alsense]